MAEKTEKATSKKLRDARKKGQVAKSQDFPSAMTFVTSIAATLFFSTYLFKQLGSYLLSMLTLSTKANLEITAGSLLVEMMIVILTCSLPIAGLVAIVGLIVGFLVVGPTFATEIFKPDIKRFNPVDNIKQKFKMKTVVELLKSIFKICGAALLIYLAVRRSLPELVATVQLPIEGSVMIFKSIMVKVMTWIGIYFIIIALVDLVYQRMNFAKEMKMEKFQVKQEMKDTEGNPEIKGKRRQIAQEIAYDEGSTQVRRAKAIISNPHDIAVAIGYEPQKYKAPWIIAMGTEISARSILQIAEKYNIPIMRNVPLAHQLLEEGKPNEFIPESTYEAIGDILLYIASLKAERGEEL